MSGRPRIRRRKTTMVFDRSAPSPRLLSRPRKFLVCPLMLKNWSFVSSGLPEPPRFEMRRRGIEEGAVRRILAAPEQRHAVRPARDVLQSRIAFADKTYLPRVFVDIDRDPAEHVTTACSSPRSGMAPSTRAWSASP